ncbi:hypothetical protein ACFL1Z_04645 [Thermodesulfobacteriota bacterium]
MRKLYVFLSVFLLIVGSAGIALAGAHFTPPSPMDPKGIETVHMAYECDTFTPGVPGKTANVHLPGVDLAGPGDVYRFTIIRDDAYANDPNYEVVRVIIGVHIDDYDWSKASGDMKPEWGSILIGGEPMNYVIMFPWDKRKPASSAFMEIVSDAEVSKDPKQLMPPYIFDTTALFKENQSVVIEIANLRNDGRIGGGAQFGNFVVNRIGCHVWYKKK